MPRKSTPFWRRWGRGACARTSRGGVNLQPRPCPRFCLRADNNGVIPIDTEKRIDWNAIMAEYIAGMSIRDLAGKYGLNRGTVARHAKSGQWEKNRVTARDRARTKSIQKTAEVAASNAAKLERAKGMAIDRLLAVLERYPENAGDAYRQFGDREENKYSLLNIVTALEKLDRNSTIDEADDPLVQMLKRWEDASAGK